MALRNAPVRLTAGAYILHSGLTKWNGSAEQAAGVHGMAAAAYPQVKQVEPSAFLKALAAGEIATGALLLAPFVSPRVAGAALTGFGGSLVGLYLRLPGMRKPGSIWPTQQGIGLSKDIWLLGMGLGLLTDRRRPKRTQPDAE